MIMREHTFWPMATWCIGIRSHCLVESLAVRVPALRGQVFWSSMKLSTAWTRVPAWNSPVCWRASLMKVLERWRLCYRNQFCDALWSELFKMSFGMGMGHDLRAPAQSYLLSGLTWLFRHICHISWLRWWSCIAWKIWYHFQAQFFYLVREMALSTDSQQHWTMSSASRRGDLDLAAGVGPWSQMEAKVTSFLQAGNLTKTRNWRKLVVVVLLYL